MVKKSRKTFYNVMDGHGNNWNEDCKYRLTYRKMMKKVKKLKEGGCSSGHIKIEKYIVVKTTVLEGYHYKENE